MAKNTTINVKVYLGILQDKLLPHMGILGSTVFQHDGAPCHRAATVTRWLENHNVDVRRPWPGSSPDLNPIENMWVHMKKKVRETNPSSEKKLIEGIKKIWTKEITPAYCERLAKSIPSRIKAVLEAKGRRT